MKPAQPFDESRLKLSKKANLPPHHHDFKWLGSLAVKLWSLMLILPMVVTGSSTGFVIKTQDVPKPWPDSFLDHLQSNSPAHISECIVQRTKGGWQNLSILYAIADRERAVRGETDVVNYAIREVQAQCSKENWNHGIALE